MSAAAEKGQRVQEFKVFLATTGKNGKKLLGGFAGDLNDCIEAHADEVCITVDETKLFERDELDAWLAEFEDRRGRQFTKLDRLNAMKWWGVAVSVAPASGERERDATRERVQDLSGLSFGFNERNMDGSQMGGSQAGGGSQVGSVRRGQGGQRALFVTDDLTLQGADDAIDLLIITGTFISGGIPSREAAEVCFRNSSSWIGTPHMTAMRKAGVESLKQVGAANSFADLQSYWQDGVNSLKQVDLKDGALVANEAWTQVTMSMGTSDAAVSGVTKYFWEYLTKKYKGRGFPVAVDAVLTGRFAPAAGSAVLALQAASEKAIADLSSKVETLVSKVNEQKSEIVNLRQRVSNAPPTGKGPRCYNCQEFGHRSNDCTKPKKERGSGPAAAAAEAE